MIYEHIKTKWSGEKIGHICSICKSIPAILLSYDDFEEGPFCETHWIEFIKSKFEQIKKEENK